MKKTLFALFAAVAASAAIAQTPVVTTNGTNNALKSGYENCVNALGGFPHADCNVSVPYEMPVIKEPVAKQPQYETVNKRIALATSALFDFNSAQLSAKGYESVKGVADEFKASAAKHRLSSPPHLNVTGYTDSMGSEAYNQKLSEQRAESIANALKQQGFTHVSHRGLGETDLIVKECDIKYPHTKKGTKAHAEKIKCHEPNRRAEITGEWKIETVVPVH